MHVFKQLPLSLTRSVLAPLLAGGVLTYLAASPAGAQTSTFDLTYSGASYGNSAVGTGTVTLDLDKINNPGFTFQKDSPFVTDFSLTITGASSGNGTFTFADYNGGPFVSFLFGAVGELDFSKELFGQPLVPGSTLEKFSTFFILPTNFSAPRQLGPFIIGANGGYGDPLQLTSFRPSALTASAVPEPSEYAALGAAGLSLCGLMVRAKRKGGRKATPAASA